MADSDVIIPQLDFPLHIDGSGSFAVVEQDSLDDVTNNVAVLLNTVVGEREELPEYGIEDPTLAQGIDTAGIEDAIAVWEPRAVVTLDVQLDSLDELINHVRTNVELADD